MLSQNRTISHDKGSHGVPGIFVKYDLSSIRVHIRETGQPVWQFIVRLCGIVGGIFATSGLIIIVKVGVVKKLADLNALLLLFVSGVD